MMKTVVILGAGQMGRNLELLIKEGTYELLAFGDNGIKDQAFPGGCPVLPVAEALALQPDLLFVGLAAKERGMALEEQARSLGYQGKILRLDEATELIDIRSATAKRIAQRLKENKVPGAIAELGVYQGAFSAVLNRLFPDKKLYLFDTFQGFHEEDLNTETALGFGKASQEEFSDTSVEMVLSKMAHKEQIVLRKGFFPSTTEGVEDTFAFVSLDADLYAPTLAGLEWFLPRLSPGGIIMLHDYNNLRFSGVKQAVADYEAENGPLALVPLCDMHGSVVIFSPGGM